MDKLFIIDGNSLMNRAFYAIPLLTSSNGVYSNAVFGFVNCLIKLITENKPKYLIVAFDHSRTTFRTEMYSEYKAKRKPTPFELVSQFPMIKEMLATMGITCIEQKGIEADDIIGTITKTSNLNNYIITGDRDSLQLIDENTTVWLTQKGISDILEVNLSNIQNLYNLTPAQIIDYKALAGDKSDNIPGVMGIGEKSAITFVNQYGNIENLYENINDFKGKVKEKLETGKDSCFLSKQLATIKTDCAIDYNIAKCQYVFPFNSQVKELFEKYGFNSLLKRTSIFAQDNDALMQVSQEILISSEEVLKYLVNDYSADHFSLDVRKGFYFSVEDKVYTLDRSQFGYADENQFISSVLKILEPILLNKNIVKIVPDLKANYYHLHYCKMENVFDISLANYLIKGGIKPDVYKDCTKFYNIYKEQIAKMQELNLLDLYYNIELPLEKVLYFMEKEGFAVDKDFLHTLAEGYKKELLMLENQIKSYSSRLGFNVKSPRQIGELLYVELGITDKFNRQHATNVDKLQLIINEHPVVPIILRYRKVLKLYSTYIEPYEKMLKTRENNILYTVFNQMQTSTGRLSSSEPNLQNIPVRDEEGKALRKIFISRFDGGKIVSADYNQIELRLLANFSNDNKLLNDYNSGSDIHRVTASQIFGVPCEEITNKQRQVAKAVNFGIIYGMSSFGLAKNIDISIKEAKQYISVYFEKYPGVKDYLDGLVQSAKQLGFARTLFGRIRNVPEISSSNGMQRTLGERIAMNMPLQGSASDIIKLAMLNVYNRFEKEKINSKLILQIHDELIVDVYPGEEQLVQDILQEEMQNVYQFKVPLLIGIGMGKTWYDCK